MLKKFNDNLEDIETERKKIENKYFEKTGNELLVTPENSIKQLCNKCKSFICLVSEESLMVSQTCGYMWII